VRNCSRTILTFNLLPYYSRGGYLTVFNRITPPIIGRGTTFKSIYPCHLSIAHKKTHTQDYIPQHTHPTKYDRMPLLGNPTLKKNYPLNNPHIIFTHKLTKYCQHHTPSHSLHLPPTTLTKCQDNMLRKGSNPYQAQHLGKMFSCIN
jgi:hypothetical protein